MQMIIKTSIDPKRDLNHCMVSGSLLYYFNAYVTAKSIWLIDSICIELDITQISTSASGYLFYGKFVLGYAW